MCDFRGKCVQNLSYNRDGMKINNISHKCNDIEKMH